MPQGQPPVSSSSLARWLLRFALAYGVVVAGALLLERPLEALGAPLVKLGLGLANREVQVHSVTPVEGTLRLDVSVLSGRVRSRGALDANARTMLVGPILALTLVFTWRARRWREKAVALGIVGGLSVVLVMVDLPVSMSALLDEKFGAGPGQKGLLSFAWFLLDNGGRQIYAVLAAGVAVGGARALAKGRPAKPGRGSPSPAVLSANARTTVSP